ncbi:MAG TPA: cation-transporting P-type ATPase, partial [Verrucomicrobiae bacterium]
MSATEQLPPTTPPSPKRKAPATKVPTRLSDAARADTAGALRLLETGLDGLSETVAGERLEQYGPNEVSKEQDNAWSQRLWHSVRNPLVILLTVLAIITFSTAHDANDPTATTANL